MTESQNLDRMTLKDLRKLAGQHQVPQRSTLSKEQLLQTLRDTLKGHLGKTHSAKEQSADQQAIAEPEILGPESIAPAITAEKSDSTTDSKEDSSDPEVGQAAEGPSKRRRRRRRRRGAKGDGEGSETPQEHQAQKSDAKEQEAPRDNQDSPVQQAEAPQEKPTESTDRPAAAQEKQTSSLPPESPKDAPQHSAKPRLEGPQRSLPSVLDRLRVFSAGILELCDPETPSWAQARLSELLAEIGVTATPCTGLPHPDFHQVCGEDALEGIAPGHISMIESPGFALRGDRGDLFPLRPARVRIAPGGKSPEREDSAPESSVEAAETATPVTDQIPDAEPKDAASDATAPSSTEGETVERKKGRRRGKKKVLNEEDANPAAAIQQEADEEAAREIAAEVEKPPRIAPELRHRPADEAPLLPLLPIEAEELAQRPKSEGFRDLGLNEQILADLHSMGFAQPSPIQAAAIPCGISGGDLIGQALTGTGKTAAFILPILHRLYSIEGQGPVALVLCPTRELARQVHHETTRMAGSSGARAALIYGGVPMDDQIEALARRPHIVIGTPGRIIDHLRRRNLDSSRMSMVVLDEADQMLDIGFLPDITYILKHTPATRQTMLFSATMPDEIKRLASDYMSEPQHIHCMPESATVAEVDQKFIAVDHDKKTALLAHFIESKKPEQMVVFCKTKHQTDRVARVLKNKKLSAGAIHGDLSQNRREATLRSFREGKLNCLIATNVAARGLDIPSVSHVLNYDIPETPEEYVHRIGRTGRMGKTGIARTFITPEDGQFLLEIEKHIGLLLEEEEVEGMTASTAIEAREQRRTQAASAAPGPRLLKPIAGGIRLGRRRR